MAELQRPDIALIKTGFGVGGASLADITFADHLRRTGHHVRILTGFVDAGIHEEFKAAGLAVEQETVLAREAEGSSENIYNCLQDNILASEKVIFSQSLCAQEYKLGTAALRFAQERAVLFRQHNYADNALLGDYGRLSDGAVLPVSKGMAQTFLDRNTLVKVLPLPPLIDGRRFTYSSHDRSMMRQLVRKELGIAPDDFVLFHPSRVGPNKGVDYSLMTACELQQRFPNRQIKLYVAGGNRLPGNSPRIYESLQKYAADKNFSNLHFLNGSVRHNTFRRIADFMVAADVVTYPSSKETFGLGIAEAALCKVPVLTRRYNDQRGYASFEEVYGHFEVMSDPRGADTPSEAVLTQLGELMVDPTLYDAALQRNHQRAARYTIEAFWQTEGGQHFSELLAG